MADENEVKQVQEPVQEQQPSEQKPAEPAPPEVQVAETPAPEPGEAPSENPSP